MSDGLVAPPTRLPEARPLLENISKAERKARQAIGPRTRLTQKLADSFCMAISTSGNPAAACRYVGIDQSTLSTWRRTAAEAAKKRWDDRSEMERRCLQFDSAVTLAEGQFQMRLYGSIASAAGATRVRPTKKIRRTILHGGVLADDGSVTGAEVHSQVLIEEEQAEDWRAAQALGKMAWPEEMGDRVAPEEAAAPVGSLITGPMVFDRLQAALRVRRERGIDDSDAIDTTAELTEGEPDDPPTR